MKIIILNTSECIGGAAVAANRLKKALRKRLIDATMFVRDQQTEELSVVSVNNTHYSKTLNFIRFVWERLIIFLCNHLDRLDLFKVSIANTGTDISVNSLVREADIIHLHWVNQGFLSLNDIKKLICLGKPIVWTMHDMWPCTGICHHAWGCERFMQSCGQCRFLGSKCDRDLSYYVFKEKRFIAESNIHIVTVSSWLKGLAEKSAITKGLNISVIPNVIDVSLFYSLDKKKARKKLSISDSKYVILMGAARIDDPIKGFDLLQKSLALLPDKYEKDILLVLFGGMRRDISLFQTFSVEICYLGSISDASKIAELYSAADVTVTPSLYETFGQTITESMACGCPVVSFDNSGQTDIIDHKENGYLAKYKDVEDLAIGIQWVLDHPDRQALSDSCIKKVKENYTEQIVAEKYISLYKELLK